MDTLKIGLQLAFLVGIVRSGFEINTFFIPPERLVQIHLQIRLRSHIYLC